MTTGKRMQRVPASLPESPHRKAKIKAAKTDKPMAQVVRKSLEKWVSEDDDNGNRKGSVACIPAAGHGPD